MPLPLLAHQNAKWAKPNEHYPGSNQFGFLSSFHSHHSHDKAALLVPVPQNVLTQFLFFFPNVWIWKLRSNVDAGSAFAILIEGSIRFAQRRQTSGWHTFTLCCCKALSSSISLSSPNGLFIVALSGNSEWNGWGLRCCFCFRLLSPPPMGCPPPTTTSAYFDTESNQRRNVYAINNDINLFIRASNPWFFLYASISSAGKRME